MAIQFTDFSRAPLIDSPWKDALENVLKGYKMGQEPARMKQESEQKALANEAKRLEVEHQPREYELNDKQKELVNAMKEKANSHYEERFKMAKDLNQANINKANRPASSGSLTPTGDIRNQLFIDSLKNTNPELGKKLQKIQDAAQTQKQTKVDNQTKYANSIGYKLMPTDERKRVDATAVGMGFDPTVANKRLASGDDLENMAAEKGFTLDEVKPNYPLSGTEIKDLRRRNAFNAEMNTLDKIITEGLAPYSTKTKGWSFEQIKDSLDELAEPTPEKQEKLGKFLAARMLAPELAGLRMNAMGGKVGIEGIRHLTEVALANSKILESLLDEPTFIAFQNYARDDIDAAINSYSNYIKSNANLSAPVRNLQNSEERAAQGESINQPQILGTENGFTRIRIGNKVRRIPVNLVDRYILEHSKPSFGEENE